MLVIKTWKSTKISGILVHKILINFPLAYSRGVCETRWSNCVRETHHKTLKRVFPLDSLGMQVRQIPEASKCSVDFRHRVAKKECNVNFGTTSGSYTVRSFWELSRSKRVLAKLCRDIARLTKTGPYYYLTSALGFALVYNLRTRTLPCSTSSWFARGRWTVTFIPLTSLATLLCTSKLFHKSPRTTLSPLTQWEYSRASLLLHFDH